MAAPARAADDPSILRRLGVIAATLVLVALSSGCVGSQSVHGHSCGPTDQKFIQTASADMVGLGVLNADYESGAVEAKYVSQQAFDSAVRIQHADPRIPLSRPLSATWTRCSRSTAPPSRFRPKAARPASACTGRTGSPTSPTTCSHRPSRPSTNEVAMSDHCSEPGGYAVKLVRGRRCASRADRRAHSPAR